MQIICNPYFKIENFNILFIVLSLQVPVYCILNKASQVRCSDAKYSFETLDLY